MMKEFFLLPALKLDNGFLAEGILGKDCFIIVVLVSYHILGLYLLLWVTVLCYVEFVQKASLHGFAPASMNEATGFS